MAADRRVAVTASFDEYLLTIEISWTGQPFEVARVLPSEDELLEDDSAMFRLSSILIARAAARIAVKTEGTGQRLVLTFNH